MENGSCYSLILAHQGREKAPDVQGDCKEKVEAGPSECSNVELAHNIKLYVAKQLRVTYLAIETTCYFYFEIIPSDTHVLTKVIKLKTVQLQRGSEDAYFVLISGTLSSNIHFTRKNTTHLDPSLLLGIIGGGQILPEVKRFFSSIPSLLNV